MNIANHWTSIFWCLTLQATDLAASKMLANSDRQADDGVFSRDIIDLAMLNLKLPQLQEALGKSTEAYGSSVARDLAKAIDRMQNRQGWLDRCMKAMAMTMPKAVLCLFSSASLVLPRVEHVNIGMSEITEVACHEFAVACTCRGRDDRIEGGH